MRKKEDNNTFQTARAPVSKGAFGGGLRAPASGPSQRQSSRGRQLPQGPGTRRRRRGHPAAVVIRNAQAEGEGEQASYASIMRLAKEKVSLLDLGIEDTRIRRDARGGILVEIPGIDGAVKADALAEALVPILQGKANVTRPIRRGEVRIVGLDVSISPADIQERIASGDFGTCRRPDVTVGPIT
ncbi:uncharacterized protein LOC109861763 [Pseudomyrmex gracilis]|uniref:uncharacterized protein LOC109861763 n=1 Tax=Pseudomyrmex gracilis TaxID=219809 RepID=UPI000995DD64|nr:uncharacterized protein LOC109861763 [Pseudomyrmex gracilis]